MYTDTPMDVNMCSVQLEIHILYFQERFVELVLANNPCHNFLVRTPNMVPQPTFVAAPHGPAGTCGCAALEGTVPRGQDIGLSYLRPYLSHVC